MGYDPTEGDSKEKCPLVMYLNMADPNKANKNRVSYLLYSSSTKGPCIRRHSTWKMYYITFIEIVP